MQQLSNNQSAQDNQLGASVLLVTATRFEIEPTLRAFGLLGDEETPRDLASQVVSPNPYVLGVPGSLLRSARLECLITGVGQMQCAATLMARLAVESRYRLVIQAGLAGSFCAERYPKRTVVRVSSEFLGDFGAENNGGFMDISDIGLLPRCNSPFSKDGSLVAPEFVDGIDLSWLPAVRSVTVNRTLSEKRSIDWIRERFDPQVVNMEGAALFYVCCDRNLPFIELRAVSDIVGPRDKSLWDIPGAVEALNRDLIRLVREVLDKPSSTHF